MFSARKIALRVEFTVGIRTFKISIKINYSENFRTPGRYPASLCEEIITSLVVSRGT